MVKRTLAAALFLAAGLAYAQPTPTRHPPKYTVATAPSCVNGEPKLYAVTDAASTASCTVGGGSTDLICQCLDGTASVVGSGSGSGVSDGDKGDITVSGSGATWTIDNDAVALGTDTSGGYAASLTEGGAATTATALAANGANCSAGQFPLGVDASGAAESCSTSLSGNAATATALAANPADCSANQFAQAIDAGGALTCAAIADADVPDNITVSLAATATALAANGANCSAGQYPLGVDASGAVESCTADSTTPASDAVTEAMLKAVDAAGDEECLTYESTVGDFEWQSCDSTVYIGGSTGATDNAVLAADGAGGATLQARDLTVSDVSGGVVTLATTAGNALAIANTNPAATTGASVAGDPLTITAGNAVASTDTAGAAAGGGVTITSGNAARNTSGSAAGGEILIKTGDGIGGGAQGKVRIPSIVQIEHPLSIWGQQLATQSGQLWILNQAGTDWQGVGAKYFHLGDGQVTFSSSTNPDSGDVGIERLGVGVIAPTNASSGVGWINNQAGYAALASDYTNATATPTNITALTTTLLAGRKYTFRMVLFFSDSQAAEGALFDFDGGTATATDFRAHAVIYDSALLLSSQSSALATDFAVATATGASMIEVNGSFTVNAAGTFIPRAAQNSHTSGTLTVETGSHLWVEDTTFN